MEEEVGEDTVESLRVLRGSSSSNEKCSWEPLVPCHAGCFIGGSRDRRRTLHPLISSNQSPASPGDVGLRYLTTTSLRPQLMIA
ncbi:unnamed protein product [Boreogadus saida]